MHVVHPVCCGIAGHPTQLTACRRRVQDDGQISTEMRRFGSAKRLASWAGVSPGHNDSAGQRRKGRTLKDNRSLCFQRKRCCTRAAARRAAGIVPRALPASCMPARVDSPSAALACARAFAPVSSRLPAASVCISLLSCCLLAASRAVQPRAGRKEPNGVGAGES